MKYYLSQCIPGQEIIGLISVFNNISLCDEIRQCWGDQGFEGRRFPFAWAPSDGIFTFQVKGCFWDQSSSPLIFTFFENLLNIDLLSSSLFFRVSSGSFDNRCWYPCLSFTPLFLRVCLLFLPLLTWALQAKVNYSPSTFYREWFLVVFRILSPVTPMLLHISLQEHL